MTSILSRMKTAASKRADYRRTLAELNTMDDATARDLNLSRYDFAQIAHSDVYGN